MLALHILGPDTAYGVESGLPWPTVTIVPDLDEKALLGSFPTVPDLAIAKPGGLIA